MIGGPLALALDLAGIFVFALSGAALAVRKQFDVVGVFGLALATSLGGGLVRDVLIGITPPNALVRQSYLLAPVVAAILVLALQGRVRALPRPVLVFDAAGLGLFVVSGASIALDKGVRPVAAVLVGTVSAVGGGVLRDVLAREVPVIFRPESGWYAIPAALGATATVIAWETDIYGTEVAVAIVVGVFVLRILALWRGWHATLPGTATRDPQ